MQVCRPLSVQFKPFDGLRLLLPLILAAGLLVIIGCRGTIKDTAHTRRMALSGALVAVLSYAALSVGGCDGGSTAVVTPATIVMPLGNSTIVITLSQTSSTGQPLQLQPIQLTLTVR